MAILTLDVVRTTKNLETFALTVLPRDRQRTLQYLYVSEVEGQARLGNPITLAVIDGGRGQLVNVKNRAQAFFANQGRVVEALQEAWKLLVAKTRLGRAPSSKHPGRARASYALYLNGRPAGDEGDIARLVKASKIGDRFSIVGPGVPYGRKLYWNPLGKPRKARKKVTQFRQGGSVTQVYGVSVVPLHQQVKRVLARKYRELVVSDRWVVLAHGIDAPRGERWPAITIGMKAARVLH